MCSSDLARRYGRYVEGGTRPHKIPIEYMKIHNLEPGRKGGPKAMHELGFTANYDEYRKARFGSMINPYSGLKVPTGWWVSGRAHPFIRPALEASLSPDNIKAIIERGLKKHLRAN